ncbi:MAG: toxin ParE1/3/4 [Saprospiraceae bacterium]|jgi:toxin ParE1/3/4
MNKPVYILSAGAEEDLRSITQYTLKNHGHKQTLKYRDELETCADNLANGTYPHKVLTNSTPKILYLRCQHHYIFGYREDKQIIIMAILHKRMDLINRLTERLNKGLK